MSSLETEPGTGILGHGIYQKRALRRKGREGSRIGQGESLSKDLVSAGPSGALEDGFPPERGLTAVREVAFMALCLSAIDCGAPRVGMLPSAKGNCPEEGQQL